MATLGAIIIAVILITVFGVLGAQARDRKAAQNWRNMAISHEELRSAEDGIRKHSGISDWDAKRQVRRTIGGGRS